MNSRMLAGMHDRVTRDRQEGDVSYFQALALKMEFIVKLVEVVPLFWTGR